MRIGIFGGSFNPPHMMHKNIALELLKMDYLDKVIYVPTGGLYNKVGLASEKNRYEMLQLMIGDNVDLGVSDYEFGKLTYTYQTLDYFKDKYPGDEIYFICGTDNLKQITSWKNYKYILDNFKLIVIRRDNNDVEDELKRYNNGGNILILDIINNDLSSTRIRKFLKEGKSLDCLVSKNVVRYIRKNNLYEE